MRKPDVSRVLPPLEWFKNEEEEVLSEPLVFSRIFNPYFAQTDRVNCVAQFLVHFALCKPVIDRIEPKTR